MAAGRKRIEMKKKRNLEAKEKENQVKELRKKKWKRMKDVERRQVCCQET